MNVLHRLIVTALLPFTWSVASASFCTTYAGAGKCMNISGTSIVGNVPLSASAVFEVSGTKLAVSLINDAGSSATQLGGAQVLTGLFFNLKATDGTLTPTGSYASLTSPLIGTATLTGASTYSLSQNEA